MKSENHLEKKECERHEVLLLPWKSEFPKSMFDVLLNVNSFQTSLFFW